MTSPWGRIRHGATALAIIVVVAAVGYRLAGFTWIDAIYMVAISVSTVGYGEIGPTTPVVRLWTIGVLIFGISASVYTFGGFMQLLTQGEIERALGRLRMTRELEGLQQHVIICGFGRIGRILAVELTNDHTAFVVVDNQPTRVAEAQALHYRGYLGDATDEETLVRVGIARARSLLTTLPDDAANVFIALTSRNLNPTLNIIARAEQPSTQKKLMQAGANHVVLPAAIGAQRMAAMVTHPSAVDFLELMAGKGRLDIEIDEYQVAGASTLAGKTVREIEASNQHGLLTIAIRDPSGGLLFNPDKEQVVSLGQTLILMGKLEALRQFRRDFLG